MSKTFKFTASHGVPFTVRIVRKGEAYGFNNCRTADETLVEFYDGRHAHTEFGQFVTRYTLQTLDTEHERGLLLDGGIPAWRVDAASMRLVAAFLAGAAQ